MWFGMVFLRDGRPPARRQTRLTYKPVVERLEGRCLPSYTITDLGTLGGASSYAYGLSPTGYVVGTAQTAAGLSHAFLYRDGEMTDLGTLGGAASTALGVNTAGLVAGVSDTAIPQFTRAFLWQAGVMPDLGPLGGVKRPAPADNGAGQVVCPAKPPAPLVRLALRWEDGAMTDLGTLPAGSYSNATALNAAGLIAGYAAPVGNIPYHAFMFTLDGVML